MANTFFTADLHVGSKNIIGYCNRPYSSVEEMDEALIDNYNSVVSNKDTVYLLGDLVWGHQNYRAVLSRLNGQKHLILGNHDNEQCYKKLAIDHVIGSIRLMRGITIEGQYIWMGHYPMRSWNRSFHGSWMCYGHIHNTLPDYGLSTDVGVDKWNYFPVSYEQLKDYFKGRDKLYNMEVRDDYSIVKRNYLDHFTEKYKERTNAEALYLETLIGG